ncbi:hypothetical protein [Rhizomonospora bruguierae]|uniref:hypothetical protein n=1 Tax=Rhizomonospora bruguierae TaxID=1581705 RepID=UPI001BCCCE89|nr:hypothetical protein [Micromonospora sp. NBRC 107566]
MQPVSPYTFNGALGHCPVGAVWSAVDEQGRPLTVAVLDPNVARDPRWRDAFAAAVSSLARPGPENPRHVRADFTVDAPWAAYAGAGGEGPGAERVFESLGMQVQATEPDAPPVGPAADPDDSDASQPTARIDLPQQPTQPSYPAGTGPNPAPTSAPPVPISGVPDPVSGIPVSPASQPQSPASYDVVYSSSPAYQDPFSSPVRHIVPSEPPKRRTGLWVGIAVVLVVLLAGAGTLFALTGGFGGGDRPEPRPSATTAAPPVALPPTPPVSPGVEPPTQGSWPTKWPRYSATDQVKTLTLEGLGFPVKVPPTWQCTLAGQAEGLIRYTCGTPPGQKPEFGGDLIVRACAQPCDEQRQTEMRQAEEAWGAQWIRSGQFSTYAEQILQVDGEPRHGLVVVGYFRGGDSGEIDRQLVFRMTAPQREAQTLRRVATYLRDTLVF